MASWLRAGGGKLVMSRRAGEYLGGGVAWELVSVDWEVC